MVVAGCHAWVDTDGGVLSTAVGAARSVTPVVPTAETFESQGTRRRAQITAIATTLIVTQGADAVHHAVVAEQAGLVRTAVYRYFPSRDDLLASVALAHSALHAERMADVDVVAGVFALGHGRPSRMPAATRALLERLWDPRDWTQERLELRLASLILMQDKELMGRLRAAHSQIAAQLSTQQDGPLERLGLDPIEAHIVTDSFMVAGYHTTVAALAG